MRQVAYIEKHPLISLRTDDSVGPGRLAPFWSLLQLCPCLRATSYNINIQEAVSKLILQWQLVKSKWKYTSDDSVSLLPVYSLVLSFFSFFNSKEDDNRRESSAFINPDMDTETYYEGKNMALFEVR